MGHLEPDSPSDEAIAVLSIYKQDAALWQQVCDADQKHGGNVIPDDRYGQYCQS
ncbi:MAG: hypothetical protein WCD18_25660 [Thermosynechococcaceae cyanobacterium]